MNYAPSDWVSVPPAEFNRYLAASNPLRTAWSDGELIYEKVGEDSRSLGFITLKGICLVPRGVYVKYFTPPPP